MQPSVESHPAAARKTPPRDYLREELEAFLCRSVRIPDDHELSLESRLRRDLRLRAGDERDLMERYFDLFRIARGDYDDEHAVRVRAWQWRRRRRQRDITLGMMLRAARRGVWSSEPPRDDAAPEP